MMRRTAGLLSGVTVLALMVLSCAGKPKVPREVLLLCGGSMRAGLEAAVAAFVKERPDIPVLSNYAGSGELIAQLEQTGKGDIYVCHDPFMDWAARKGIVAEYFTAARLRPVIAVPKGNPKAIGSLHDLARPGLRLGIGDDRYSTSGIIMAEALKKAPYGDSVKANVVMNSKNHQERASGVALGSLDATVIWNAVAAAFADKLQTVDIPDTVVDAVTSATCGTSDLRNVRVTIGLTTRGRDNPGAVTFYKFLQRNAAPVLEKQGFAPPAGGSDAPAR